MKRAMSEEDMNDNETDDNDKENDTSETSNQTPKKIKYVQIHQIISLRIFLV